jgi:hypothetical protein
MVAALDKGLLPSGIQHKDASLQGNGGELTRVVADPQPLDWNVGVAVDRRIDRNEIVLAGELDAVAGEIDHRDGVGGITLRLLHEIAERLAQRVGIEVARTDHVEPCGLQVLGNQTGIVGRGRKRPLGVGAIPDHQREPLFLRLRGRGVEPS